MMADYPADKAAALAGAVRRLDDSRRHCEAIEQVCLQARTALEAAAYSHDRAVRELYEMQREFDRAVIAEARRQGDA